MSVSVSTDKTTYVKGNSVSITASISSGGVAISGASVSFTITKPDGSAVKDAYGKGVYKMRLNRKAPLGTYQVRINVTSGGQSASAITSFGVQ